MGIHNVNAFNWNDLKIGGGIVYRCIICNDILERDTCCITCGYEISFINHPYYDSKTKEEILAKLAIKEDQGDPERFGDVVERMWKTKEK